MAATVITNFIAKALFKKKGAIANNKAVEFSANALEQRLKRLGIDPNAITSENELNQILSAVKQAEDAEFSQRFGNTLSGSKFDRVGEVFDMTGKKLDSSRGIMGGTQIDEKSLKEGLMKTDNPFSDLVKTTDQGPKTLAEREAEVLARLEKENTEAAQRIRDRKRAELENRSLEDYVDDAGGVNPDDPRGIDDFIPDPEDMATGGRVGLLAGSVPKIPAVISALLKNKKKVNQAVNNIFPTGDYKLDAEMVAESIVENNPKTFNNMLYDDLNDVTRSEIYGAALSGVNQQNALMLQMKKATRPEKTLQSMKEGKGINMSDPDIADEFARFMKETDPKGTKELEQKLQLENFKTKDRSENADGGRIGLKDGTFEDYMRERERFEKERSLEQLFKEYKEDLRRQEVGEQKQMAADGGRIGFYEGGDYNRSKMKELADAFARQKYGRTLTDLPDVKRFEMEDLAIKSLSKDIEKKADGGRIGLKAGMTKRAFLKLMGAGVAGIGAVKSGILGLGKGATKQAAKEVVQQTTSGTPPPYFFKLAEKIKKLGDDVTAKSATKDREVVTKYKDYELTEDITTGEQTIQRMKIDDDLKYDASEYYGRPVVEEVYMSYKPGKGQVDETMKGKTPPDEYIEDTSLIRTDKPAKGGIEETFDGVPDDVLKEVEAGSGNVPESFYTGPNPIKRANGGLAYMLGE